MKVLIVDDYPDMAESLAQILMAQGHEVRTVLSSKNAAVALDGFEPDAAILDLAMPEMDGFEVAKNLCRALDKKPLLIALTGHAKLEERSRSEGFDYHFLALRQIS